MTQSLLAQNLVVVQWVVVVRLWPTMPNELVNLIVLDKNPHLLDKGYTGNNA